MHLAATGIVTRPFRNLSETKIEPTSATILKFRAVTDRYRILNLKNLIKKLSMISSVTKSNIYEDKQRVLVVDDEQKISEMVRDYLEAVDFEISTAKNGKEALSQIESFSPDLIVLDIMMPGLDGLDLVRKIRTSSNIPIILLTARASEQDKLIGLELGADDYVTKPFSMKELAARIRAVLRRSPSIPSHTVENSGQMLVLGALRLDLEKRTVKREGEDVQLTGLQFDLLARMMKYPGKVFTRMQLLESVQEYGYEGYERTVDVHIKNIRKALEPNPAEPKYIQTVWGVGYKLSEETGS